MTPSAVTLTVSSRLWGVRFMILKPAWKLSPSVTWLGITGRISVGAMYEEHREEYVRRFGERAPAEVDAPGPWQTRPWWSVVALWTVLIAAAGVVAADFSGLQSKIADLSQPPDRTEAELVAFPSGRGNGAVPNTASRDPFDDCLKCHDKKEIDEGERFPHFDHADDYFAETSFSPKCGDCHQQSSWHKGMKLTLTGCVRCHSLKGKHLRPFPSDILPTPEEAAAIKAKAKAEADEDDEDDDDEDDDDDDEDDEDADDEKEPATKPDADAKPGPDAEPTDEKKAAEEPPALEKKPVEAKPATDEKPSVKPPQPAEPAQPAPPQP